MGKVFKVKEEINFDTFSIGYLEKMEWALSNETNCFALQCCPDTLFLTWMDV